MCLVSEMRASFQELSHAVIRQRHWYFSFTGLTSANQEKAFAFTGTHNMISAKQRLWTKSASLRVEYRGLYRILSLCKEQVKAMQNLKPIERQQRLQST
jgi:hypothetical protein